MVKAEADVRAKAGHDVKHGKPERLLRTTRWADVPATSHQLPATSCQLPATSYQLLARRREIHIPFLQPTGFAGQALTSWVVKR